MSPYQAFNQWLFDGQRDSPIPKEKTDDKGKITIPDITKYNSPIHHTYVISLFLRNGQLNYYLNKHFNNINLRYLSREDILLFIKKCVYDFNIKKRDLMFYKRPARKMLYEKLREKVPEFKNDDISLLCDIVENSDNRDAVYDSLDLEKPKKQKIKKAKKIKSEKMPLNELLNKHFSTIDV